MESDCETTPNDDLDAQFGEALTPISIDGLEQDHAPISLHHLDSHSAELLRYLMVATINGLGVSRQVYCEVPILWIVDRTGKLWFSLEEIVSRPDGEFLYPMIKSKAFRDYLRTNGHCQKLGHPALIGGAQGRIGGEIGFDLGLGSRAWYIANWSRRYGSRLGRTEAHLENAAQAFAGFGIDLKVVWSEPRPDVR